MREPLLPATPAFTAEGTPYSPAFDDIYHSSEGGAAQARHVFLGGNDLPARWRGRERFTILETGFGLGLNFLATWHAWKEDPQRPAKLHYVSIEKHPFAAADLAQLHAHYPEFGALSEQLRAAWPLLVPGMHRLELDGGSVVLTVLFDDVERALPELRLAADALFLDGFSPAKNPDMWSSRTMKGLPKLAAAGATFATYTAASSVRDAVAAAGFAVEKRAGFAKKRDMLCGRLAHGGAAPVPAVRRAIVIGAGVAGSAVCERLAARGWEVALIERHDEPAAEASGNHAGAFHPLVTRDDSHIARLSRASFLYALRHWETLTGVAWARCGVLQMPRTDEEDASQQAALTSLGFPPGYAQYVSGAQASRMAGTQLAAGGIWFPEGGWVRPASLVRALLAKANVSEYFGVEACALEQAGSGWVVRDAGGKAIAEAPFVVLANARDATRLAPVANLELRSVRGQVTYLPATKVPAARSVLLRGGLFIPPVDGLAMAGATFDIDDEDAQVRTDSHAGNLDRLARILPGADPGIDPAKLDGRVAFRAVAPDRMPVVGAIPGLPGVHGAFAYASRGILWCSLMAELLASRLEGDPLPIEARLADAVAPERFRLRAGRRSSRGPRGAR